MSLWTDKIRSIAVDLKDCVTGLVDDFCIRVASVIVEDVDSGIIGGLDICAGGNVIKGVHNGVINCAGIEEKFSSDLLQKFDFIGREGCNVINFCVLNFLSVVGSIHPGWAVVFWFWDDVFEFLEGLFNVPLHADLDGTLCVVSFEVHSYVLFGFPINFQRVFDTDTGIEMINILFVCAFDTKVVDHESEGDVP